MALNLTKPNHSKKLLETLSLRRYHNAFHSHFSAAERRTATTVRRDTRLEEQQVLDGNSLPLSDLLHSPHDYTDRITHCQISCILSHPASLDLLQKQRKLLGQNYKSSFYYLGCRGFSVVCNFGGLPKHFGFRDFCSVGGNGDCSDLDDDDCSDLDDDDVVEGASGSLKSETDLREVDRVSKVVEESFALNRNMEAALDKCGIRLTHGLVVDVLKRFKHARKPAFKFFCWAGNQVGFAHDSTTYNWMMRIFGNTRQFETMVSLLEEMGEKGLLTIETFEISIKAFAASKQRRKAVGIFELMNKYKFKYDVDTINCLLDALGRAKLGDEAQHLFGKLEQRFTPNLQTYTILLNGWCKLKKILQAGRVWNEMIDKGFKPDVVAYNTMLEGLVKVQYRSNTIKLFEVMKTKGPTPNVQSYTILLSYLCKHKKMNEAVEYFEGMLDYGCKPDAAVYTCLITGFGNMKKMDTVFRLLEEMKENGFPPDGRVYSALIKLMRNHKMPDDAFRIYKKMVQSGIQPTIHTCNRLMKLFFDTRNFDMGCASWEEMQQNGCCPDDKSYTVLIGGLIMQGRSVEACKYLEEMIEKGMKAPQLNYNKFAADFSRAGKPYILEELAEKMKSSGKFSMSTFFSRCAEVVNGRGKGRFG